jgi:hypothetical protein
MTNPGDVILYKNYKFEDGSNKDKLFVVLNSSDASCPCLVLKTTSQRKRYDGASEGCNTGRKKTFYVPETWKECFSCDTYIQLPIIIELPIGLLLSEAFKRNVIFIDKISEKCLTLLMSCLKKYKDDIAERHWNMVFKLTK